MGRKRVKRSKSSLPISSELGQMASEIGRGFSFSSDLSSRKRRKKPKGGSNKTLPKSSLWDSFRLIASNLTSLFSRPAISRQKAEQLRALQMSDVDSMPGHDFEHYVAALLRFNGFNTKVTKGSGDAGVDIIAKRGDISYSVQCKRSNSKISRRAISDAVAGMAHYECTHSMVVTNSHFMPGAIALAKSNRCHLVDRDALAAWAYEWQKGMHNQAYRADA